MTRALLKYHTHTHKTFPSVSAFRFFAPFLCNHPPRMNRSRVTIRRARVAIVARARLGDSLVDSRRRSRSSSRARRSPASSSPKILAAMSRTAGTTNARDGRVVEGLRCVVCRAVGPSSFAASDSGFYVCVRCGTQTQSQVEDAAEMGLEEAEGGDVFGGGGGPTARGLRRRVGGSRREGRVKEVRLGKRARTAMRDGRRAVEAYASAFQAVLEAQCARLVGRGVVSRREDGAGEGESGRAFGVGLEVTVREVWARYARESGVLDVAEDRDGDGGGDAGEEKTSTEKTSLAREMTKRLPMVMSLGIVYVACARRREAVLPVDLSRMAAEGTLPYLNAYEIIKEKCGRDVVELLPRDDIFQPHDWQRRLPTPERIVAAAAYAAGKIRAQLPPINASALLTRFVGEFNLDARVVDVARRVLSLYLSPALRYGSKHDVGTPESTLFAYLVVTLKFLYGLDGRRTTTKRRLSARVANGKRSKKTSDIIDEPTIEAVSPSAWRAWARGVVALGAPARVWSEESVLALDDDEKDERVRFAHYELFSGRNMPFPFDRIEEKLLKIVPHARLHGTTEARRPPGPPRPGLSREDPYFAFAQSKLALARSFERRARAHVALGVFEARAIARERNESYDRFGALRNDLERETMSNVGGEALRAASSAGAVDFVRRVVVEYAHKSEKEMLEVLGGEKQVHIVKLDALLRRIFAATVLKSTKSLDFTLEAAEKMKRQKTSIRRAVEREDEDLASKFTPQDLNAAISRAVVEISKEQEHLDVVTHVVAAWSGYDASAAELADVVESIPRPRLAATYLPATCDRDYRKVSPEYAEIVDALAKFAWISPEALHASVMELEFVLFRVEEFIKRETGDRWHHSRTSN